MWQKIFFHGYPINVFNLDGKWSYLFANHNRKFLSEIKFPKHSINNLTAPFFACGFLMGYAKACNHPQPPITIHKHPQTSTTTHKHQQPSTTIHSHPQLPTTTHNYPQLPKTIYNHPQPPKNLPAIAHNHPQLPITVHNYPQLSTTIHKHPKVTQKGKICHKQLYVTAL